MRSDADAALWDVAPPTRPSRVEGVTMAGFRDRGMAPAGVRLIPHSAVTLVLTFGAGSIAVDDATGQRQQGSLAAGLWLGEIRVRRAENFECVQVRLSPVVARAILGASLVELDGAAIPLGDLWGREAARITEQLGDLSSWEERFAVTDALLARRLAAGTSLDPEVAWAWGRIVASRGVIRIDALATELGWSRKRLWSRFAAQIGIAPKRAAKLVRFDHAVHGLAAGRDVARVAADGGYTDRSHLHRDVVSFTGLTPATVAHEPFLAVDDIAWARRS